MQNNPWLLALMIGVGAYFAKMWFDDFRVARAGQPNPRALPGATGAPIGLIFLAAAGALILLALETWGENALGISEQQTDITALFAVYTLIAAVIEEIIFRGYIVLDKKGPGALWVSIIGASVLFAAFHPYLWRWEESHLSWHLDTKGWFSTAAIFVGSLWFYTVRFLPANRTQSLLPCFAAHAAKNLGVIAIKGMQGHLVGWY